MPVLQISGAISGDRVVSWEGYLGQALPGRDGKEVDFGGEKVWRGEKREDGGVKQGNAVEERYDGQLTQWIKWRKCRRWKLSIIHL